MLTKQANDSWRACFATRTPPAGIKGERVQTHISFSLRSRALQISECLQSKTTALVLRRVSGLGCRDRPERRLLPCLDPPSIPLCVRRASIPVGFRSTGKRANSPLCRGSLFSAGSWTRSTSQHVSQRSMLSQC